MYFLSWAPMSEFGEAFATAFALILEADPALREIVALSLQVSLSAVALSALIGLPLGALLAMVRFPGRGILVSALNALMGLPPVVVGLAVYLMLSRSGPLGELGLLFTPTAMVIAQTILVSPIIAALTFQAVSDLHQEYDEPLRSMGAGPLSRLSALVWDARFTLVTAVLAGFGRAVAEVGAVMIVGGNIKHVTRVMTTAIALETSKGELALALALGVILVTIALSVNMAVVGLRDVAERRYG